jgi:hypothetical protein
MARHQSARAAHRRHMPSQAHANCPGRARRHDRRRRRAADARRLLLRSLAAFLVPPPELTSGRRTNHVGTTLCAHLMLAPRSARTSEDGGGRQVYAWHVYAWQINV